MRNMISIIILLSALLTLGCKTTQKTENNQDLQQEVKRIMGEQILKELQEAAELLPPHLGENRELDKEFRQWLGIYFKKKFGDAKPEVYWFYLETLFNKFYKTTYLMQ